MYEALSFLYAFNFHNYGFVFSVAMIFWLLNQHDYTLVFTDDPIFRNLFIGSAVFMILALRYFGFPLLSTFVSRYLAPTILFIYGYMLAMDKFALFQRNLLVMAFATALHGVLNIVTNLGVDVLSRAGRYYDDIAGGQIVATIQNLLFVMSAGLLFYYVVCYNRYIVIKGIGCFMGVMGSLGSVLNASRTVILLTGMAFFLSLVIYLYCENEHVDTALIKMVAVVVILLAFVLVVVGLNLFDIRGKLANSALGKRSENIDTDLGNDTRWQFAGDILMLLPSYPMGNVPYPRFAHNLFVDIAKESGIIPFVLYILFVVRLIRKMIWMTTSSIFTTEEKVAIIPVAFSLFFVFFTEPIMEGAPQYLALFCYVAGGITCMTDCAQQKGLMDKRIYEQNIFASKRSAGGKGGRQGRPI